VPLAIVLLSRPDLARRCAVRLYTQPLHNAERKIMMVGIAAIVRGARVQRASAASVVIALGCVAAGCHIGQVREPLHGSAAAHVEGKSMSPVEIQAFVDRFTTAWSTRRNEDFEAIWHADGDLVYPFASRVIKGSEIGVLNELTKKNAPHLTWRPLGWTAHGNVIVVEWESSNRYGDRSLTWRGVDKLTLEDGKIIEEVVYTDTAPFHALRRGETFAPLIPFPNPAR
jgi:SnoaL-like domain